jgi:hypothetical protein
VEKRLHDAGISCWLDESQIPVGERFVTAIGRALHDASVFLAIDSEPASTSYWVSREIQAAERLRSHNDLGAIVVLSTSASHFLPCEPDARCLSPDLIANTVAPFISNTSLQAKRGRADREAVIILDRHEDEALWLGFSQELRYLDGWWSGKRLGMWISGLGGSGKTSLVRTWIRAFQQIGYRELQSVQATFLYVEGHPTADAMLREIVDTLSDSIGMNHEQSLLDPIDLSLARLQFELGVREERGLLVINSPENMDAAELLKVLHAAFKSGLRVIVTARNSLPQQLQSDFECIALSSMSNTEARLLVARLFGQREADPIAVRLIDALGGHPLSISVAIKRAEEFSPSHRAEAAEDLIRLLTQADSSTT